MKENESKSNIVTENEVTNSFPGKFMSNPHFRFPSVKLIF